MDFEQTLRANIVAAARAMNSSGARFSTFKKSRCNAKYWTRTEDGGFQLNNGVTSAAAIRDIFAKGYLYAFECATAAVIILYKGVLDTVGESSFNALFANLLLYDWHYDSDLRLITVKSNKPASPGDVLYFKNPDVSPDVQQWQGENVIVLGNNLYYGHGMGIVNAQAVIAKLNRHRKPGSSQSAYLTDQSTYPDFEALYEATTGRIPELDTDRQRFYAESVQVKMGVSTYISHLPHQKLFDFNGR